MKKEKKQNIVPLKDLNLTDRFLYHIRKGHFPFGPTADGERTQGIPAAPLYTDGCVCNE